MKRTVQIKLSFEDREYLDQTVKQFKEACQVTVNEGWNSNGLKTYNRNKLHHMVYERLRERTDLQANLVVRAIARGAEAIKGCVERLKNGLKVSKPNFTSDSIAYDKRTLTVKLDENKCTISTINGRIDGDFVLSKDENDYYKKYLNGEWSITHSTIEKHEYERNSPYYLHLGLEKEVEDIDITDPTVMGVDLGINNLAVTSTGKFYSGSELNYKRKMYEEIRGKLQEKGTRSAYLTIQQMGERENRSTCDTLHRISKDIVKEAKNKDVDVIAFENLKYVRKRMPKEKQFHTWAFEKLYHYVKYKAREIEISVKQVDPENTSRICNRCGHTEKGNRTNGRFKCRECGYELQSDYNASKNIGLRFLRREQKSSVRTGYGQLALKSGVLKPSGKFTPR